MPLTQHRARGGRHRARRRRGVGPGQRDTAGPSRGTGCGGSRPSGSRSCWRRGRRHSRRCGFARDLGRCRIPSDRKSSWSRTGRRRFRNQSLPYLSTIVFVVRKGNPFGIRNWPDLLQDGLKIITPEPQDQRRGQTESPGGVALQVERRPIASRGAPRIRDRALPSRAGSR